MTRRHLAEPRSRAIRATSVEGSLQRAPLLAGAPSTLGPADVEARVGGWADA
jgi:hypothetical protein